MAESIVEAAPKLEPEALATEAADDTAERVILARQLAKKPLAMAYAVAAAGLIAAAALFFDIPPPLVAVLTVLGAGLGFLGYIDAKTKLILNKHTGAFAIIVALSLIALQFTDWTKPVLILAAGTAAAAFLLMIFLWLTSGFASGGDIKLAPVAAAALSIVSPMTASIWLMAAFMLCLVVTVARAIGSRERAAESVPMAPFMALAVPIAIGLTTYLYSVMGVPLS